MDLNGFKAINDTLGHQGGDRLLMAAGERPAWLLRTTDTVARFGGDELTIILPDVNQDFDIRLIGQKNHTEFIIQTCPHGD